MSNQNKIAANLVIKLNTNPMPNACPFCGVQTNPNIGAELFIADSETIVCFDCGTKHAPTLAALLAFGDYSRLFDESGESLGKRLETYSDLSKLFVRAERKFGDIWEWEQNYKGSSMNAYQNIGFETEVRNGAKER